MDNLVKMYIQTKISFVLLVVLGITYIVVCFAFLWPMFPYPGVSWDGLPWVNFREWFRFTLFWAIFFVPLLAYRAKWSRDAKKEETRRYGSPTVAAVETKKKNSIDEMIKKAAEEAAREAAEEKEEKEGGEK
jgi:hypothetical protein